MEDDLSSAILSLIFGILYLLFAIKIAFIIANNRNRNPVRWGVLTVLFTPIITYPILFLLPKKSNVDSDPEESDHTDNVSHNNTSSNIQNNTKSDGLYAEKRIDRREKKQSGYIGKTIGISFVVISIILAIYIFLIIEIKYQEEMVAGMIQDIVDDNTFEKFNVDSVSLPLSYIGGGRVISDAILSNGDNVYRIEFIAIFDTGYPIYGENVYVEIDGYEFYRLTQ